MMITTKYMKEQREKAMELVADRMATLKRGLSAKAGVADLSPVAGIEHHGLATWYALQVGFDSPTHDPNRLAKFLVIKYEQKHQDTLFFKNGSQRKLRDTQDLAKKIATFIQ